MILAKQFLLKRFVQHLATVTIKRRTRLQCGNTEDNIVE